MKRGKRMLRVATIGLLPALFGGCASRPTSARLPAAPPEFRGQFLRFCDLAAADLMKDITPFDPFNRENPDPATHHMPAFEDAHAVRALAIAYDLTGERRYLDACRRWADHTVRQQAGMIPRGAYYMNHSRAPGQSEGQWNAADSGSVGLGVLATAIRCPDPAERQRYLDSVRLFASLVMENYVCPDGGISNGCWAEFSGPWWCSTANVGTLCFALHEATGERKYLDVAMGAVDWMLRRDFRDVKPITFQQRPSGIIFYCFDLYAAGLPRLKPGTPARETALRQIDAALEWLAANQKTRGADVPDYTERNVDMAAQPCLMYAFAGHDARYLDQVGPADTELRYVGDLLNRPGFNVSQLKYWEVMTWGMLSYAERLAPGALRRGTCPAPPRPR